MRESFSELDDVRCEAPDLHPIKCPLNDEQLAGVVGAVGTQLVLHGCTGTRDYIEQHLEEAGLGELVVPFDGWITAHIDEACCDSWFLQWFAHYMNFWGHRN